MQALTINNLYKTYANGVQAVKSVDLKIEEGDFFALLGPNGAGKSTIIGIISSLVNKTSGQVKVFNYDLDHAEIAAKTCMGLVPQEINFNQFEKVIDIVVNQAGFYGMGRRLAIVRAEKYLQQLDLWEKRDEVARSLSGGMKRRLMIVRALVHEPRMLILDEPTAGLDIELRRSTWDFLHQINKEGTTIILTTHYLEEAEHLCHGIAIINHGEILEHTTVKHLLSKLQHQNLILTLKHNLTNEKLPQIPDITFRLHDSSTLEVTLPTIKTINSLFAALSANGIEVESLRNKTNRLEELFLKRIGESNAS